jgi:hypothetical protein
MLTLSVSKGISAFWYRVCWMHPAGFGPLVELPGASGVAAGVSSGYRVYAETAYGIAGGEAGYKRALDIASRDSFPLKTIKQQEKIAFKTGQIVEAQEYRFGGGHSCYL